MWRRHFSLAAQHGFGVTGSQQADAERQAVASQYSLSAQQITIYDKCIIAMEHKGLRAGGSKQQFCGCPVQSGLSDLQPDESDTVLGWIEVAYLSQPWSRTGRIGLSGSDYLQRRHTQHMDVCRSNAILVC
jgi:hypothetical protein